MHPLVRFLRIALPISFVAFVVLIIASYTRAQFPKRVEPEPPETIRPDDRPSLVMSNFEDTHSLGGRLISRIRANRTVGFESGWMVLEDVELALFSQKGQQYTISAADAQFNPDTKHAEALGGVTLSSNEGVSLSTDTVLFDGEHVTNDVPVNFKVAGWTGRAGGIKLRVEDETLHLIDNVTATLSPDDAEHRVDLTANVATSYQRTGDLLFEGAVRLSRRSERLTADSMRVGTSPDTRELTSIAGEGNVVIRLLRGSSLVETSSDELLGGGEMRIIAERFAGEVGDGGLVRALTIIGETIPVLAIMGDAPRREMTASMVRIELTPAGTISSIHATGDTSFSELGPVPRVVDSDEMRVAFDPDTREASSAIFKGDVHFRDPENEARAQRAIYDMKLDSVIMQTLDSVAPTLLSRGSLIRAEVIEISPRAGTMKGNGSVVVRYHSDEGSQTSVIFAEKGQPMFVNADSMFLMKESGTALFQGKVKAWQQQNSLFADEVQIVRDGDELVGTGNVRIVVRQPSDDGTIQSINARSQSLNAARKSGQIVLRDNVVIDEAGRSLQTDLARFIFDEKNKIERMEADGNVVVSESEGGRSAKGDTAVYRMAQRTMRVLGSPASLKDASGEVTGSEIRFDTASQKVEVIGGEATYNPK